MHVGCAGIWDRWWLEIDDDYGDGVPSGSGNELLSDLFDRQADIEALKIRTKALSHAGVSVLRPCMGRSHTFDW